MLKLVKLKKEFSEQLIDMMDEWTMANEKILFHGRYANVIITILVNI